MTVRIKDSRIHFMALERILKALGRDKEEGWREGSGCDGNIRMLCRELQSTLSIDYVISLNPTNY